MKNKGQIQLALLTGITALIAAVAAPILWVAGIKETNAVQSSEIITLQRNYERLESKMDNQNLKIDALLIKSGISPQSIIEKNSFKK